MPTCPACNTPLPSDRRCDSCDLQHARRIDARTRSAATPFTVARCELADGTTEWIALSVSSSHHRALRAAGFRFDRRRKRWATLIEPDLSELLGLPMSFAAGQGAELACVA